MHLASINALALLVNTREVLIRHKEILQYPDLLYAVCLLRLLREFDTLLSIAIYYELLLRT